MQLEMRGERHSFVTGFHGTEISDAFELLLYGAVASADFEEGVGGGEGGCVGPDAGGEHADGEASAFFVGPVYDADWVVGFNFVGVEDAEEFDAGADAEYAVLGVVSLVVLEEGSLDGGGKRSKIEERT